MNRISVLFATLLAFCTLAVGEMNGQMIHALWSGEIESNGEKLLLVFETTESGCTLEVPAQGARIPAEFSLNNNGTLKILIPRIGAKYEGMYFIDKYVGTYTQNGMEFPLTLKRGRPLPNRPQTPAEPFPYKSEEVTFANSDVKLGGTLTTPEGADFNTPVILMVTGSGQQDRDETIMFHKPFAVIADAFARNGISTLRYDDRGFGYSTGDFSSATTDTLASDALAGIKYLREKGYTKVGVLGHSEGGTIAFMLAAEGAPDFLISLAGMAENGEATLLAQTEKIAIAQGLFEDQAKIYAKQAVASTKANAKAWMKRFLELDPSIFISKVTCPVLALNGEKDLQVIAERNIPIIKDLLPSATIKTYPDLNHLFQHCATGVPTQYYAIDETISPEVLADMVSWIQAIK